MKYTRLERGEGFPFYSYVASLSSGFAGFTVVTICRSLVVVLCFYPAPDFF